MECNNEHNNDDDDELFNLFDERDRPESVTCIRTSCYSCMHAPPEEDLRFIKKNENT